MKTRILSLLLSLALVFGSLFFAAPAVTTANAYPARISLLTPANADSTRFVDISSQQGQVDFFAMKAAGVRGVMLRASYEYEPDARFYEYAIGAKLAGLEYGAYAYVTWQFNTNLQQAYLQATRQAAVLLAQLALVPVRGYVVLDIERLNLPINLTVREMTEVSNYFLGLIRAAGYSPMLYTSIDFLMTGLDASRITDPLWISNYTGVNTTSLPNDKYGKALKKLGPQLRFWQYTHKGRGADYGVSHKYIDLNYCFGSFVPQ